MSNELGPWCSGQAECLTCKYIWVAVWQLGADMLECPKCGHFDTTREQGEHTRDDYTKPLEQLTQAELRFCVAMQRKEIDRLKAHKAKFSGLEKRLTNYLSTGGLFNPELMGHDLVTDMIIDVRNAIKEMMK